MKSKTRKKWQTRWDRIKFGLLASIVLFGLAGQSYHNYRVEQRLVIVETNTGTLWQWIQLLMGHRSQRIEPQREDQKL